MNDYKYALDVCEMMIDRLHRELYSNNSMLGAINSAYEALSTEEKQNYQIKRTQLNNLLKFRTQLLDSAMDEMVTGIGTASVKLTKADGFDFSL